MALVAMVLLIFCISEPASAERFSHSAGPSHKHVRRALMAKRSAADCPEGNKTLRPYIQDQIKKLSSASAQQGGKELEKTTVLPGNTQVHVQAKSDQKGSSRSWSWLWSSHSSSSSSSSSSTSSTRWSDSHLSSDNDSHQATKSDDGDSGKHTLTASDNQDEGHSEQPLPQQHSQPQATYVDTVTKSGHSEHQSSSKHSTSTTTKDGNGKVVRHTSNTESSSSSSSSYYSQSSNVFNYVISGNTEQWNNAAPFTNGQVEWTRSDISISSAIGPHIARPAKADTCNRKFPFTNQPFTANDKEPRFTKPFPKEALDPVSRIALDLHNAERARYGLPLLQWNAELANMASCWADLKAYGHSEDHFCASGENIAMGLGDPCYSNPMEGMKNAIYSFLDEDRNWAQSPHENESNGHWTQAVWKDTRFVGCAVSQRKDFMEGYSPNERASMFIVCEYYPAGNVEGQFGSQVPPVRPMPQLRSSCSANERHGG
ncbi:related to fruiting body protein SC7 precursor [Sporisorium scitamineum]|uniref:Related to fruiting body protein SC7 n=1 Tax=Sporisorium scitamineum TaxID=49012 RepID=A0A127Z9E1_9BASI|nr:related to fruiting body protein SC7 precursor [Sporisorium scitamineum]